MPEHGNLTSGQNRLGGCPDESDLRRFDRLALDPPELERLADHIASCPRCRLLLEQESMEQTRLLADVLTPGEHLAGEGAYAAAEHALLGSPGNVPAGELHSAESTSAAGDWSHAAQPPEVIGPYEILYELGRGGMGIVYRARHANLKRDAAVKVLPPELTARPSVVERFYQEMETIGQLHDPHIVHAYDAGEWHGIHFLAMEFVDGVDVARLCRTLGALSTADACEIICQAAQGLETARRHHMVHRDIKPSNLIVTRDGRVKILDLGLTSMRADNGHSAGHEPAVGTVDYMAPEQWHCDPAIDIRADIYSLGCTLYTLLAGRPPFASAPDDGVSKMQAHLTAVPPSLLDRRPDVPQDVCAFLERMIAKSPDGRPSRPLEVLEALEPFRRGSSLAALVTRTIPQTGDTQVRAGFTTTLAAGALPQHKPARRWVQFRWSFVLAGCLVAASLLALFFRDGGRSVPRGSVQSGGPELPEPPSQPLQSGTDIAPLVTLAGHNDVVSAVAISPDGREILTASHDRTLRLWDPRTGEPRKEFFGHADEVWDVAFRPGTRQCASASKDGTVRLWDLDTGEELHRFDANEPNTASVAFSRDGSRMLTAGMDDMVRLWNVDTRELERTLRGHLSWARDARFLRDERYAISCDNATMGILWDLETGRMQQIYVGHNTVLSSIRTSADGRYAASSSWDEMIRIWEVERGRSLQVLHRNMQPVRQVEFVGDTYYLLSASEDHKARLWNPFSARVLAEFSGHEEMVLDVACHVESGVVATASADRTARIWPLPRLADPPQPAQLPAPLDLKTEAAAQGIEVEEPLHTWEASTKTLRAIAAHPDETQVATGGDDAILRIWSVPAGELVRELSGPADGVLSVAYSHSGDRLAAAAKDGNVYVWDLTTDEPPRALAAHTGWVTSVTFRHDGAELISAGFDGTVCSWNLSRNLPAGQLNRQITVSNIWIHDVHYWLDGEKIFAVTYGMDDNPRAVDLVEGALVGQFGDEPFGHILACGEISPDGSTLAAAGWRSSVQLAGIETDDPLTELQGHGGPVYDLHWEPDSRHVITASRDGTLRRWDVTARREVQRFVGSAGSLRGVAVLPKRSRIAAIGDSGRVLLFPYPPAGDQAAAPVID